ncbi:TerC family protein [Pseudidiomarina donghaiensis]|uniref:TerC family protein n=1 Tax=Pseudidiomarina donghaiensis TaxID=519452 RepID=A0A432XFC4_9GAMM|nr:TerC family protein [Pseudidiomarina donghaiensis]RUO47443.1 hypothetical protein CWE24_08990 [Pseudidiomarina donghaiensis]SFV23032.1 Membrane protein TerC, possibly involved in tellurium resistance [Pseudidiomarina donghaiensis]
MFEWIMMPEAWLALLTLTLLEIVLGIDNIIFISILVGRLPESQRQKARQLGLMLAMGMRIALLLAIVWVMGLTKPLFSVFELDFSGRDLILLAGGMFLLAKSTLEIHHSLEGSEEQKSSGKAATFGAIITQIAVIDIVFSLDSVITAVGLVEHVSVMIIAVVVAVLVMLFAAKAIGDFVDAHPTIKMLALSFLILIGFTLVGEGLGFHVPKGYVYFAMAFSLGVELLNLKIRKQRQPVHLKKRLGDEK